MIKDVKEILLTMEITNLQMFRKWKLFGNQQFMILITDIV